MKTGPWYRRYPSNFIGGVVGLGPDVIGCYAVVLDLIYDKGGPIQHDCRWIAGILGCSTRKADALLRRLEEAGKIVIDNGWLTNRRAENELENAAKTSRELSEAGAKGGRTRAVGKVSRDFRDTFSELSSIETSAKGARTDVEKECDSSENKELGQARLKQQGTLEAKAILEARTRREDKQQHLVTEAAREPPAAAAASTKKDDDEVQKEVALPVQVGNRVLEIMGVTNDPRWLGNWARTSAWLSEGFDPALDIYPAVELAMVRRRERGEGAPNTLKYFDKMIRERHRERRGLDRESYQCRKAGESEFVIVKAKTEQFRAWLDHYRSTGRTTSFMERVDFLTVPSEWPPRESAA